MKIPFYILSFLIFLVLVTIYLNNTSINVLRNPNINLGLGWKNNQSFYAGSELSFKLSNSKNVSIEYSTNSKADQGIEILVDEKSYIAKFPDKKRQKISISVDKEKTHTVTVHHFCIYFYNPCQITLFGIYVKKDANITSYKKHDKVLSLLGDSISTIYGNNNYSQILANNLGYELHDASLVGSTVSETKGVDNAIKRYKKDILGFKSDTIIINMGTNDAAHKIPLDTFARDYSKIVYDIKKSNPNVIVFLTGILQRKDLSYNLLDPYNQKIKEIASEQNVYFIDTFGWLDSNDFSDQIHPSIGSQKKLAKDFEDAMLLNLR